MNTSSSVQRPARTAASTSAVSAASACLFSSVSGTSGDGGDRSARHHDSHRARHLLSQAFAHRLLHFTAHLFSARHGSGGMRADSHNEASDGEDERTHGCVLRYYCFGSSYENDGTLSELQH